MPTAAPHACPAAGCSALLQRGERACPNHLPSRLVDHREAAHLRGYDQRWLDFVDAYRRGLGLDPESDDFAAQVFGRNRCTHCGRRTRLEYDHITPLAQGGARLDWRNVQPLCRLCHARKTLKDKLRGCLTVVWGPPCAGKSTRASTLGGDVVDWDVLLSRLSGLPMHDYSSVDDYGSAAWDAYRKAVRQGMERGLNVVAVTTDPSRLKLVYNRSILVDPGRAVCEQRAMARPDPARALKSIAEWYDVHEMCGGSPQ